MTRRLVMMGLLLGGCSRAPGNVPSLPSPARTPPTPGAASGLAWRDATGARVPVTGEIYGLVFYRDDSGNFWTLDLSRGTVSPVGEISRVFESADCSTPPYVLNPLPARVTFNYPGLSEARVVGTAAIIINSTFHSTNTGSGTHCQKSNQSGSAVAEQQTKAVPRPVPSLVLPLHPELIP